ncbi:werner helicase-interacting protein 1 family member [Holotrichia oblita]|uniref:Werner helicase-interacting protein 1 family member n=1 Tax=Holotrichia oblita TaxID=644536 RepID=A0ACB9TD04_HOLOL|nr:werner helicase-interacting protein 1 family member [Holotrichia oblita]
MSDKNEDNQENEKEQTCPICFKQIPTNNIEVHANRCLFLHSDSSPQKQVPKRKRSPSPKILPINKSPCKSPAVVSKSRQLSALSVNKINPGRSAIDILNNSKTNQEASTSSSSEAKNNTTQDKNIIKDFKFIVPLAKQAAPKSLDDFFEKGEVPNMIIWGPPGCGKTSLAGVIHEICKSNSKKLKYVSLCAANCGVKEVQSIVSAAKLESKFGRRTILFMDEVHRFNKKQQDIFLLHVERGDITLIGATTENPSFTINNALLSRCRVIVMEKLKDEDLLAILQRTVEAMSLEVIEDENNGLTNQIFGLAIKKSALQWLADVSDGDARIALSNLQLVVQHNTLDTDKIIAVEDIQEGIKKSHLLYDRKGEEHYNIISAMHKSIRGSDPNAALYWTTRMIVSGEDPLFIARRMVRAASEDIGNADPNALQLAVSTMQGCQLLGMPEADVLLAQCAIYLARAPKSREADSALGAAKRVINECKGVQPSVPMHIRNAPTRLMKDLGYGKVAPGTTASFMPAGLENVDFF